MNGILAHNADFLPRGPISLKAQGGNLQVTIERLTIIFASGAIACLCSLWVSSSHLSGDEVGGQEPVCWPLI